jgi:hypothetical protein
VNKGVEVIGRRRKIRTLRNKEPCNLWFCNILVLLQQYDGREM